VAYRIFTEEALICIHIIITYITVGGNTGEQSLSGGFKVASLPQDYESLARNQLVQPLITFRVLVFIVVIPC
jgi:hypothetical protein